MWKIGQVCLVLKNVGKFSPANHCPISLLSLIKFREDLTFGCSITHESLAHQYSVWFPPELFGHRSHHRHGPQMDQREVKVTALDSEAAFDRVQTRGTMFKLASMGFKEIISFEKVVIPYT